MEVALDIDPTQKMFQKGDGQLVDADGCPLMEKVKPFFTITGIALDLNHQYILRKAFDCSVDGKVRKISLECTILKYF